MYLTRARLRPNVEFAALKPLLMQGAQTRGGSHHLIWSLMADSPDRERDFLYREASNGSFYVTSAREPAPHPLWEAETRRVPQFEAGDALRFSLRANPVVRRRRDDGRVIKRDPIMEHLHPLSPAERRKRRMQIAEDVTREWLARIGAADGYQLNKLELERYGQERFTSRRRPVQFGVVDVSGLLTITDAEAFANRMRQGFGASRAWGCGLMLCRRIGR